MVRPLVVSLWVDEQCRRTCFHRQAISELVEGSNETGNAYLEQLGNPSSSVRCLEGYHTKYTFACDDSACPMHVFCFSLHRKAQSLSKNIIPQGYVWKINHFSTTFLSSWVVHILFYVYPSSTSRYCKSLVKSPWFLVNPQQNPPWYSR